MRAISTSLLVTAGLLVLANCGGGTIATVDTEMGQNAGGVVVTSRSFQQIDGTAGISSLAPDDPSFSATLEDLQDAVFTNPLNSVQTDFKVANTLKVTMNGRTYVLTRDPSFGDISPRYFGKSGALHAFFNTDMSGSSGRLFLHSSVGKLAAGSFAVDPAIDDGISNSRQLNDGQIGYLVIGTPTTSNELANLSTANAIASYFGGFGMDVRAQDNRPVFLDEGTMNLSVDFGANQLSGSINYDSRTKTAAVTPTSINNGSFTTSINLDPTVFGAQSISGAQIEGSLFGPNADEIGGVLTGSMVDSSGATPVDMSIVGGFHLLKN